MFAMKIAREDIYSITQALIAVIVVVGGGFAIITQPDLKETLVGVIGVIIGYYFTGFINTPVRTIVSSNETSKND